MTLNEWIKRDGNMLSNITACWCCQVARVTENQLRNMQLATIFALPGCGVVASREIRRYSEEHPGLADRIYGAKLGAG